MPRMTPCLCYLFFWDNMCLHHSWNIAIPNFASKIMQSRIIDWAKQSKTPFAYLFVLGTKTGHICTTPSVIWWIVSLQVCLLFYSPSFLICNSPSCVLVKGHDHNWHINLDHISAWLSCWPRITRLKAGCFGGTAMRVRHAVLCSRSDARYALADSGSSRRGWTVLTGGWTDDGMGKPRN